MSISINTNSSATSAARQLSKSTSALDKSAKSLASGKRELNPAELAVATKLLAEADTSQVAATNISYGVSVADIADSALGTTSDITNRLTELAAQASSDTLSASQRSALNNEYQALTSELDRISQTTEFNGQKLLSADSEITVQAGNDGSSSSQINVRLPGVSSSSLGLTADISTAESARTALDQAKAATSSIAQSRGEIGSSVNRLGSAYETLKTSELLQRESASRIQDVDVATEAANYTNKKIGQQAAVAVAAQANIQPSIALKLLG